MKIKSRIFGMSFMGTHFSVVIEDTTDKKVKLPIIVEEEAAIDISKMLNEKGSFLKKLMTNLETDIEEIFIHDLVEGVFKVKVTRKNGHEFDLNVSNGLRLCLATKCNLFVSEEVYKSAGVIIDDTTGEVDNETEIAYSADEGEEVLDSLTKLKNDLEEAISDERYEDAAKLRDLIDRIEGE